MTPPHDVRAPVHAQAAIAIEQDDGQDVRAVMADLMPWALSILLHAALVILALGLLCVSIREPLHAEVFPTPNVGIKPRVDSSLTMSEYRSINAPSSQRPSPVKTVHRPTPLVSNLKLETKLIGVRGGDTAKATPWGVVGLDGFMGDGIFGSPMSGARKVAYLVDASGSLIDTFPFVLAELRRSIGELRAEQSFTVIFFQGDRVIESPAPGLKRATTQNRQRVIQWLSPSEGTTGATSGGASGGASGGGVTPMGRANPVAALKQALRYRPELVFLLSDNVTGEGQYEVSQNALLTEIRRANVAGTKINTLQFLYPDPLTRFGFKGTMDLIAAESGGVATFVSGADLAIE